MASEYTMKRVMQETQIVTLASVLEILEELPPAMAKKRILNLYEELRAEDV
jgi:hypothetical protein